MSAAEKEARDCFTGSVLARDGGCQLAPHANPNVRGRAEGCGGRRDAHHIIRLQTLRAHVSTLPEHEGLAVMYDPRIGICVCRVAHTPLTSRAWHLRLDELPERAVEFAQEHGLGWALEAEVPNLVVDRTGEPLRF